MFKIIRYFVVLALVSSIVGGLSDLTENEAATGDIPVEEIAEQGTVGYFLSNLEDNTESISDDATKEAWIKSFREKREQIGNGIMIVELDGEVKLSAPNDGTYSYAYLAYRKEALSSALVEVEMTEDDLYELVSDYNNRGYFTVKDLMDELKAKTNCSYDLRFDTIYVTSSKIILSSIYEDEGVDLAIGLSEMLAGTKSVIMEEAKKAGWLKENS